MYNLRTKTCDHKARSDINPNYLSDERGVSVLLEGVRVAQEVSETTLVRSLGTNMVKNAHSECRNTTVTTTCSCYVLYAIGP